VLFSTRANGEMEQPRKRHQYQTFVIEGGATDDVFVIDVEEDWTQAEAEYAASSIRNVINERVSDMKCSTLYQGKTSRMDINANEQFLPAARIEEKQFGFLEIFAPILRQVDQVVVTPAPLDTFSVRNGSGTDPKWKDYFTVVERFVAFCRFDDTGAEAPCPSIVVMKPERPSVAHGVDADEAVLAAVLLKCILLPAHENEFSPQKFTGVRDVGSLSIANADGTFYVWLSTFLAQRPLALKGTVLPHMRLFWVERQDTRSCFSANGDGPAHELCRRAVEGFNRFVSRVPVTANGANLYTNPEVMKAIRTKCDETINHILGTYCSRFFY
jgi:hypothetical protein